MANKRSRLIAISSLFCRSLPSPRHPRSGVSSLSSCTRTLSISLSTIPPTAPKFQDIPGELSDLGMDASRRYATGKLLSAIKTIIRIVYVRLTSTRLRRDYLPETTPTESLNSGSTDIPIALEKVLCKWLTVCIPCVYRVYDALACASKRVRCRRASVCTGESITTTQ